MERTFWKYVKFFLGKQIRQLARTKAFDREQVLTKAMKTFWRYGYERTSMQALVSSMGISRGSLYDTFGDKRSLFLAAIAYYEQTVMNNMISSLLAPEANKQTIIDLFQELIATTVSEPEHYGCLITNTAVELCPDDGKTQSQIERNFRQVTNAFKQALIKAQAQGELASDRNLDSLAEYLTSSIQGLRVVAKVNRDRQRLNNIVEIILAALD